MATWNVFARDRDRRITASVDTWTDLQAVLRFNDLGTWQVTAPVTASSRALATAGNGIVIRRDGRTLLSGPTTTYTETWDDSNPGVGTLKISGKDDMVDLARALAEPDPLVVGTPTQANDRITGAAETVIRSYVSRNIGTIAKSGRTRHPVGQTADNGAGTTVAGNARYDLLLDLVRGLATAGGLGFRIVQDAGGSPLFDVYAPVDRSGEVVFSRTAGNLVGYSYTLTAPTASRVTVAGQGEGILRQIVQVTNAQVEADWDAVVDVFQDRRDTDENDDFLQEAATTLLDGGATAGLSVVPVDLPTMTFGDHYYLGDRVSVDIDTTTRITDVLTSVTLTVSPNEGERVAPAIGSGDLGETPALFNVLRKLGTRVGLLEKRV